jgi:hypothetical protein
MLAAGVGWLVAFGVLFGYYTAPGHNLQLHLVVGILPSLTQIGERSLPDLR